MRKESVNYKFKLFLMGKMGLVGTKVIINIRLQVCEFERQIITFYVYSIIMTATPTNIYFLMQKLSLVGTEEIINNKLADL